MRIDSGLVKSELSKDLECCSRRGAVKSELSKDLECCARRRRRRMIMNKTVMRHRRMNIMVPNTPARIPTIDCDLATVSPAVMAPCGAMEDADADGWADGEGNGASGLTIK